MNYWQRWIGDWKRKTAHLSACEQGVYGELLDYCYANDTPIVPLDQRAACRIAGASGREECAAVAAILEQFFDRTETGFMHARVAEEMAKRATYSEAQRALAKRRWEREEKPATPKGNGKDHTPTPLPEWIPSDLYESWWKAKELRTRTPKAHELAVKRLDKLRAEGFAPRAVLEHCITSGYKGIFPPGKGGTPEYDFDAIADKYEQS